MQEVAIRMIDYLYGEGAGYVVLLVRSTLQRYDLPLARICQKFFDPYYSETQEFLALIYVIVNFQ